MWSENEVEFMSTLYLPRNSPVYWPIQVSDEKNYMFFKILKIIPSNSKHKMCSSRKIFIPSPRRGTEILREGGVKKEANFDGGLWRDFLSLLQVSLVSYCSSAVAHR